MCQPTDTAASAPCTRVGAPPGPVPPAIAPNVRAAGLHTMRVLLVGAAGNCRFCGCTPGSAAHGVDCVGVSFSILSH